VASELRPKERDVRSLLEGGGGVGECGERKAYRGSSRKGGLFTSLCIGAKRVCSGGYSGQIRTSDTLGEAPASVFWRLSTQRS
jgi:hypothetical protein